MGQAAETLHRPSKPAAAEGFRQTVLAAAKRFKSSWVELGKLLVKVRDEALFEEWGYPSFEAYCLAEIRIRKQTALKLTRSFSFLDKHEPEAMKAPQAVETAPPFEVVEVLAQAEERGQLDASDYKSIRDSIWNPDKPTSALRKELVDRFAPPENTDEEPPAVKRLAAVARRLASDIRSNRKIARAIAERADALADDLEGLLSEG